jgi:hypothetical protein
MKTTGKRILEVKIIRAVDTDPDTSYYGEYSQRADSEFSIDRAHALDCASQEHNHRETVDKLERVKNYIDGLYNLNLGTFNGALGDSFAHREQEGLGEAADTIANAQTEVSECDCNGGDKLRGEYQYFNPSRNYVDASGNALPGNTPEQVREYVRQDYDRMEDYNRQGWCYIGIRAEAQYQTAFGSPIQTLTSGGLWGIESDSDKSYFAEVAGEELAQLKAELKALGFSARAISTAFKNVEEVES